MCLCLFPPLWAFWNFCLSLGLSLFLFVSLSLCIFAFLFFLEALTLGMCLSLSLGVLSFCPPTQTLFSFHCLMPDRAYTHLELPQGASGRQITAEETHLVLGSGWLGCSKHWGGPDPTCPTLMHAVSALR